MSFAKNSSLTPLHFFNLTFLFVKKPEPCNTQEPVEDSTVVEKPKPDAEKESEDKENDQQPDAKKTAPTEVHYIDQPIITFQGYVVGVLPMHNLLYCVDTVC